MVPPIHAPVCMPPVIGVLEPVRPESVLPVLLLMITPPLEPEVFDPELPVVLLVPPSVFPMLLACPWPYISEGILPEFCVPVLVLLPRFVEVPNRPVLDAVSTGALFKNQNQRSPSSARKSSAPMMINIIFLVIAIAGRL
jgi:hypothetical protein